MVNTLNSVLPDGLLTLLFWCESSGESILSIAGGGPRCFWNCDFFYFSAITKAVELILRIGIEKIEEHNQMLVESIIRTCVPEGLALISPHNSDDRRSMLDLISHDDAGRVHALWKAFNKADIHVAIRACLIRISPHLYNTTGDVDSVAKVVYEFS